ncbi:hypothetical protein [Rubellicoccus peritrichatus]|uniref:Uncharacterized protein n=1 Tax=Rubellicoccus peritrichatus TaxID=3080537 RepID=A0AAQ3QSP6_9BACT|nr:hypothetical protein [Puniceicoccus sp. CR14]WOO40384.1 hypothetical protein RZN69_17330 [Puniceicoccus sp. CR14]WOO40433.1 hypothetical protein RZN69_17575 [Puniceicoccus sp. CR14]WOO40482.1 hypothetical protein RZN69_17820 [Puniceicoccus sp. CR14]WOO40531.1 hypothetical protein RZN69_18065 [Puniceicoccus sp. CR14]
MAKSIPQSEPVHLTQGFSANWQRSFSNYPASSYNLRYSLINPEKGNTYRISAETLNIGFKVAITPKESSEWKAGTYRIIGYIEDSATNGKTIREQVYSDVITVLPDPTRNSGDTRSFNRRTRDALRDTIEKLSSRTLQTATVNGQSYSIVNLTDLNKQLDRYEQLVRNEEGRERKQIAIHFTRP